MGGLSSRYFKFLDGRDLTAHYVSIGTGQYGWSPTCALPDSLGGEMCPASQFLATLDHGDDTPGPVSYTTLRTLADDGHFTTPTDDRALQGHSCIATGIDGGPHPDEPGNPTALGSAVLVGPANLLAARGTDLCRLVAGLLVAVGAVLAATANIHGAALILGAAAAAGRSTGFIAACRADTARSPRRGP